MRALVKAHAEPGLWLQDVPEPEIGINDVLIRVDRAGICGTDLHISNWDAWAQKTIPVGLLNFQGQFSNNSTGLAAGILIAVVPILIAYTFLQRWIVGGLTAGASKG